MAARRRETPRATEFATRCLAFGLAPAWFEIAKLLECDQDILFKIDSRKMEEMVAAWYQEYGYEVTLTPRSGDLGRDIIAVKR